MKIVSFILPTQPEVILGILDHVNYEYVLPPSTGPPGWMALRKSEAYWQAHPEYLPDDEGEAEMVQDFPSDDFGTIEINS